MPASTTAPARSPVGCARTVGVAQEAARPTRNGAAVPSSPSRSPDSAWVDRPTAAKTITAVTSAAKVSAAMRRDGIASG